MSETHQNWLILNEMGATAEAHIRAGSLKLGDLDLLTAIKIGHAFTQHLDTLTGSHSYTSFTSERAYEEAAQKLAENQSVIFGETRPANRNCAVRVEMGSDGMCGLQADIRNDFEDNPALEGGEQMQRKFIETIESIDLETR